MPFTTIWMYKAFFTNATLIIFISHIRVSFRRCVCVSLSLVLPVYVEEGLAEQKWGGGYAWLGNDMKIQTAYIGTSLNCVCFDPSRYYPTSIELSDPYNEVKLLYF